MQQKYLIFLRDSVDNFVDLSYILLSLKDLVIRITVSLNNRDSYLWMENVKFSH